MAENVPPVVEVNVIAKLPFAKNESTKETTPRLPLAEYVYVPDESTKLTLSPVTVYIF